MRPFKVGDRVTPIENPVIKPHLFSGEPLYTDRMREFIGSPAVVIAANDQEVLIAFEEVALTWRYAPQWLRRIEEGE